MTAKIEAIKGGKSSAPKRDTIEDKMEQLAIKVAEDALSEDSTRDYRLDAIKVLTQYANGAFKKKRPDEPDGESFGKYKESIVAEGSSPSK